jgi:hypothetical protein
MEDVCRWYGVFPDGAHETLTRQPRAMRGKTRHARFDGTTLAYDDGSRRS